MRKLIASTAAVAIAGSLAAGSALAATGRSTSHHDPSSSRDRVSHVRHEQSRSADRTHARTDRASRDLERASRN